MFNYDNSLKARGEVVNRRYSKTTKGSAKRVKPKLKLKPVLKKGTIGIKGKVTF